MCIRDRPICAQTYHRLTGPTEPPTELNRHHAAMLHSKQAWEVRHPMCVISESPDESLRFGVGMEYGSSLESQPQPVLTVAPSKHQHQHEITRPIPNRRPATAPVKRKSVPFFVCVSDELEASEVARPTQGFRPKRLDRWKDSPRTNTKRLVPPPTAPPSLQLHGHQFQDRLPRRRSVRVVRTELAPPPMEQGTLSIQGRSSSCPGKEKPQGANAAVLSSRRRSPQARSRSSLAFYRTATGPPAAVRMPIGSNRSRALEIDSRSDPAPMEELAQWSEERSREEHEELVREDEVEHMLSRYQQMSTPKPSPAGSVAAVPEEPDPEEFEEEEEEELPEEPSKPVIRLSVVLPAPGPSAVTPRDSF
eukprot:TRINITY_DN4572_c0_g3_i1.p1 TRINITY_DN4572_c0_g3~~TRINITY_DN4572_c0_g3_i1.p1  ORF type:complete len:363 (-),score=69.33 TRINITY_DN4572_c0_g3_i1:124-1212(-)